VNFNPFHFGIEPIGIDIGSSGAKLLQIRRTRRGMEAVASARVDLPVEPGACTGDGHIVALAEAIKSCIVASGFIGDTCVLSIDDSWLRVRSIRQPRMSSDERDGAIKIDGDQRLGFTRDEPGQIGWTEIGRAHV